MKRSIHERMTAWLLALAVAGSSIVSAPITISAEDAITEAETQVTETSAPETAAPETTAPETTEAEAQDVETAVTETQDAQTQAPETKAPEAETKEPETNAPGTDRTDEETQGTRVAEPQTSAAGSEAETTTPADRENETETEPEVSYPAVRFENVKTDGEEGILLTVDAPEGALPEGTALAVEKVELGETAKDKALSDKVLKRLSEAVYPEGDRQVLPEEAAALNIWFYDKEKGKDAHVQPLVPVTLTWRQVDVEGDELNVWHLPDQKETDPKEPKAEKMTQMPTTNPKEDKAQITVWNAKDFSVYAVAGTFLPQEETDDETEAQTEAGTETEINTPLTETETETGIKTEDLTEAEAQTEALTDIYEDSMSPEELAEGDEDTAAAATTEEELTVFEQMAVLAADTAGTGTPWTFSAYYVGMGDRYHVEMTDDFNLKYQMEFHTSTDLLAGDVKITIPKILLTDRYGKDITPDDIGVPKGTPEEPVKTSISPFNYYEDEEGNLVFFNYRALISGTNCAWQVLYKNVNTLNIVDGTDWTLTPKAEVVVGHRLPQEPKETEASSETEEEGETEEPEPLDPGSPGEATYGEGTPLTGLVDTKVTLTSMSKKAYRDTAVSYTPGLYTETQVHRYAPDAQLPENITDQRYSVWEISTTGTYNQIWEMYLQDTPVTDKGKAGQILGVYTKFYSSSGYQVGSASARKVADGEYAGQWKIADYESCSWYKNQRSYSMKIYVVTAFDKDDVISNETVLRNTATVTLVPGDHKDAAQTKSGKDSWTYKDYKWTYKGDIIGVKKYTKQYYEKNWDYPGWTTAYETMSKTGEDLGSVPFLVDGTCRSFKLTHMVSQRGDTLLGEYLPGRYTEVTTVDDAVYAWALDGDGSKATTLLDDKDYYFSSVTVTQTDTAYDVWEDISSKDFVPESETAGIDRSLKVYAMFAGSQEWELVKTIPWDGAGNLSYTFTAEEIAKGPWRVKMVHNSVDYVSYSHMNLGLTIRASSPVFNQMMGDGATRIRVRNLDGILGKYFSSPSAEGVWFHDYTLHDTNYSEPGIEQLSTDLYGIRPMRDGSNATLEPVGKQAAAKKKVSVSNDSTNGRIKFKYTISGYEGYTMFTSRLVDILRNPGTDDQSLKLQDANRKAVYISDLLPYGVQYDPSVQPVAGRITSIQYMSDSYKEESSTWNKNQVSVKVDKVTPDYNGTGRTKVDFILTFGGEDAAFFYGSNWISGYGVSFGAYATWKDYKDSQQVPNIAAYMPLDGGSPLIGPENQVSLDDGADYRLLYSSASDYKDFGADINGDGITNVRNVLYAEATAKEDYADAKTSSIDKLVRADNDKYGKYDKSAVVSAGDGYTYQITVSSVGDKELGDIVVFDRLDNALADRSDDPTESVIFDTASWMGSFADVEMNALKKQGIAPVVYYNASRDALTTESDPSRDPQEILAGNGWVEASQWSGDLSEVKAIAVDLSKKSDGSGFRLAAGESVTFQVKMTAPETVEGSAVWAYNNAAFSSYVYGDREDENIRQHVIGNTAMVKLTPYMDLEIEKEFDGDVPDSYAKNSFTFTLARSGLPSADPADNEPIPFAYHPYTLYKNTGGEWVQAGSGATNAKGQISLHAGEKAVFEQVPDAEDISVSEAQDLHWSASQKAGVSEIGKETTDGGTVTTQLRSVLTENTYRPLLYLQKELDGYVKTQENEKKMEDYAFFFKVTVNGEPAVDEVCRVYTEKPGAGKYDTYKELRRTDADGVVMVKKGEILLLTPGRMGDTYEVEEILDPQELSDAIKSQLTEEQLSGLGDWIQEEGTHSGTLGGSDTSTSIRNIYKWKTLTIRKKVEQYPGDCEEEFSFRIWQVSEEEAAAKEGASTDTDAAGTSYGILMTGLAWEMKGADEDTVKGTIGEEGILTAACAGRVLTVSGLEGGKKYIVEEVLDEEESSIWRPDNNGVVKVSMPLYGTSANAGLGNYYLPRDLEVKKTVLYNESDQEMAKKLEGKTFTMTLELTDEESGELLPAAGKSYVLLDEDGKEIETPEGEERKTQADGTFIIGGGQTAYFKDVANEGVQWRVTETPDPEGDFPQILPQENGSIEGTFGIGTQSGEIVNGSNSILIIRKTYSVKEDSKQKEELLEYARNGDFKVQFLVELDKNDGEGYQPLSTGESMRVLKLLTKENGSDDGNESGGGSDSENFEEITVSDGTLWIDADTTYILLPDEDGFETWKYRVSEVQVPAGLDESGYMTYKEGVSTAYAYNGDSYLIMNRGIEKVEQEEAWKENNLVVLNNELESLKFESTIYKALKTGSKTPAAGSRITFRVKCYENGAWVPASGLSYRFGQRNVDVTEEDFYSMLTTGSDGLITYTASGTEDEFCIRFTGKVLIEGVTTDFYMINGDLSDYILIEEVPELTDPDWGTLFAYAYSRYKNWDGTWSNYGYFNDFSMYYTTQKDYKYSGQRAEQYDIFLNTNQMGYLEIAKEVNVPSTQYFTFSLEKMFYYGRNWDSSWYDSDGNYHANYKLTYTSEVGRNLEYTVYDSETNEFVTSGRTNVSGELSIQGGQYAKVSVPLGSHWKITEKSAYPYELEEIRYEDSYTGSVSITDGQDVYTSANLLTDGEALVERDDMRLALAKSGASIRSLVVGYQQKYEDVVQGVEGTVIDWYRDGSVKLYTVGDTAYVLSNQEIKVIDKWGYGVTSLFSGYSVWDSKTQRSYETPKYVSITIENLDISQYANISYMFEGQSNLTTLDLSGLKVSDKGVALYDMFTGCSSLKTVDLNWLKSIKPTRTDYMFRGCSSLETLDLSGWDISNARYMYNMFSECRNLEELDLSGWDTSNVQNMTYMFYNCSNLKTLDLSGWNVGNVTDMYDMFYGCSNLKTLDLSDWNVGNVTDMHDMFHGCSNLKTLDLSDWNTSKVTNMTYMFYGCSNLKTLDLSGWNVGNVANMYEMFYYCSNLETIYASNWIAQSRYYISGQSNVFYGCSKLSGYSTWKTSGAYCKPISQGGYFTEK